MTLKTEKMSKFDEQLRQDTLSITLQIAGLVQALQVVDSVLKDIFAFLSQSNERVEPR